MMSSKNEDNDSHHEEGESPGLPEIMIQNLTEEGEEVK